MVTSVHTRELPCSHLSDNDFIAFGDLNDMAMLWDINDANGNCGMIDLPAGGAVDVPVLVIGIGIAGQDLALFNGIAQTTLAVVDADRDSWIALDFSANDAARLNKGGAAWMQVAAGGDILATTDISSGMNGIEGVYNVYPTLTAAQEYRAGYFRINYRSTTPGNPVVTDFTGVEGVAASYTTEEAITFRGGHFRTYVSADATSTMRTNVGADLSARCGYSGGTECVLESGSVIWGTRIWMAPFVTDTSTFNQSGGLLILNEADGKVLDHAIRIWTGVYGGPFNYCFYADGGKYYQVIDGSANGSLLEAGDSSTGGYDVMTVRAEDYRTLTTASEYRAGYFRYNVRSSTIGAPQSEVTGVEGVAATYVADGNLLSYRGGHFRTYVNADATSSMKTAVGMDASARASYSGGTECVALNGTCFTGIRIWMAPYFTSGSLANINNFWGLWIYGEHATQRNADAAIMVNDAGGKFTDTIRIASGSATGTDIDINIIKLLVTGTPVFSWAETADRFELNKALYISDAAVPLIVQNTTDGTSNEVLRLMGGNRGTPADNDEIYLTFYLDDSTGTQVEFARITVLATDVTSTTQDARFEFGIMQGDSLATVFTIDSTSAGAITTTITDKMAFGGLTDWGTGATGTQITGAGFDWVTQTVGRVNTDINDTAAAAAYHALTVTVSQANSNSFFGTWTELYLSNSVNLTGADNVAAVWGQVEAGTSVTLSDTGCFTAGGYFNVKAGSTLTVASGHSLNGVRAQIEVSAISNSGTVAAFECLKSGTVLWQYGLYIADATTDIRLVDGATINGDNTGDATINALSGKSVHLAVNGTDEVSVTGTTVDITTNQVIIGVFGDGTGVGTGASGTALSVFAELKTGTTISGTVRGTRSRMLVTQAQTGQGSIYGMEGNCRVKANLDDGVHTGVLGYFEQSGTVTLSTPGINAAGVFTVEGASTLTLDASTWLVGICVDSAMNASASMNGNFWAIWVKTGSASKLSWNSVLVANYDGAITLGDDVVGIILDYNTNVTMTVDKDVTGFQVKLPALTSSTNVTTTIIGYDLPTAGAINQSAAGAIAWRGINIQMPATQETTGTVTAYGLQITPGAYTSGTQTGINFASGLSGVGAINYGTLGTALSVAVASTATLLPLVIHMNTTGTGTGLSNCAIFGNKATTNNQLRSVRGITTWADFDVNVKCAHGIVANITRSGNVTTEANDSACVFGDMDMGSSTTQCAGRLFAGYFEFAATGNTTANPSSNYSTGLMVAGYAMSNSVMYLLHQTTTEVEEAVLHIETTAGPATPIGIFLEETGAGAFTYAIYAEGGNVYFNDILFIGDSNVTNSKMTGAGITIDNASAYSGEFLALKCGDIAHGMTTLADTDTFGILGKAATATGGLLIEGFSETTTAIRVIGVHVTDNTDKTTSAVGTIHLEAGLKADSTWGHAGANANLVVIRSKNLTTKFIFDADGDFHCTDVVCGLGEGGSTAVTGGEVRAPHLAGGTNQAGADLTISTGSGTGTGDPGQLIHKLAYQAASGATVQSVGTVLLMDGDITTSGITTHTFSVPANTTLPDATPAWHRMVGLSAYTITLLGQTQVTTAMDGVMLHIGQPTIDESGGAVTVDEISSVYIATIANTGNVTLTAARMIDTGVADCYLTNAGVWTDTASTIKIKQEIQPLDMAVMPGLIDQLQPVSFRYRETDLLHDGGRQRYGVIAEELPEFLLVPGDYKRGGVSAAVISTFELAAIKYLKEENDDLKARVDELETQLKK